jgi:hypothetical protein
MAITANSFLITIPITITGPEVAAHQAVRTYYNTRIEDVNSVKVYYNGVLIPKTISTASKYYYDLTVTLDGAYPGAGPSLPPTDNSQAVFTLKENTSYTGQGYSSGTSVNTLSTYDNFTISYYYVVYMV